jgi:hypothetical protein
MQTPWSSPDLTGKEPEAYAWSSFPVVVCGVLTDALTWDNTPVFRVGQPEIALHSTSDVTCSGG